MNPEVTGAIRAALRGFDPTAEQWDAITHPPEPLAIIAGAGSGKTAVMAARIVRFVEGEVARPSEILALTFTNKAMSELEERIYGAFDVMDPRPIERPSVMTYNAFADRLVREHGVRVGIDPEVDLLSQAQSWQIALRAVALAPPFEWVESRSLPSICRKVLGLAEECANHYVEPERVAAVDQVILDSPENFDEEVVLASRRRIELCRVVREYIDEKRRQGKIDFGDQVVKAVDILTAFPSLARDLQQRYPAVLLDEYQDTNVAQRKLMQLIAPTGHNVTAVGDTRQNIYQWRGSTLFNLVDFPNKHFLRSGDARHDYLSLSENFRSGSKILTVANHVINNPPSMRRPGAELVPFKANQTGEVYTKLISDQRAEAEFIASKIEELHGKAMHPSREPTAWRDFAVLVRRRSFIEPIYAALRRHEIPVEVVGMSGLLQVPEIVDTIAWLRVVADPGPASNRWLARLLLGPRFRIHYRDVALLARWASAHTLELRKARSGPSEVEIPASELPEPDMVAYSLSESLDNLAQVEGLGAEAIRRLDVLTEDLETMRARTGDGLLELVRAVMECNGIFETVAASGRKDARATRANLLSFLAVVEDFSPIEGEASLGAFLEYLDAAEEVDETLELVGPAATDSVKLMTIHKAKGLEFEVVFVPGVAARWGKDDYVDSVFPDFKASNPLTSDNHLPFAAREDAEHLPNPWAKEGVLKKRREFAVELKERAIEDERRLFYVAITRAKQLLFVTAPWWYERHGRGRGPSQFFDEVTKAPGATRLLDDERPGLNPLYEAMQADAKWPPDPPHRLQPDPLFPDGYPAAIESLIGGETTAQELLNSLEPADREGAEALLASYIENIGSFDEAPGADTSAPLRARSLSATAAVALAGGEVPSTTFSRPLPEPPSDARRIGVEIHRWIEESSRGLMGLADEESMDDPSPSVAPLVVADLRERYEAMGYPKRIIAKLDTGEPMAELPFVLKLGPRLIRGRIDVVYETSDGGLDITDFKTGARVDTPPVDQLLVYAGALAKMGVAPSGPITLTYAYLASGETATRTVTTEEAVSALAELAARLEPAGP